jgi:microcystin-dependent protein
MVVPIRSLWHDNLKVDQEKPMHSPIPIPIRIRRGAAALVLLAGAGWSASSAACSSEPYLGSMCIMAWPVNSNFGGGMYQLADGRTLQVNVYQALYAVIGTTYGGSNNVTFQLPDLRGRALIGAGQGAGLPGYSFGQSGGSLSATFTAAQLPAHAHTLNNGTTAAKATVTLGNMAAATTFSGLAATTSLAGVTGSVSGGALSLKAYSGAGGVSNAGGNALATVNTPSAKLYAASAPDVAMAAGSIAGTAAVTFAGTPTTTITGSSASTTLSGLPTVALSGSTDMNPGGAPLVLPMAPFVAMPIYIAVQGLFPTRD